MNRKTLIHTAACVAALCLPAAAQAGAPGTWSQVTGIGVNGKNTDEIGVARTTDGVLHVAWTRDPLGATYNDDLLHSAIGGDGKAVSGPDPILGGFALNNSVDLLRGSDGGLRVFFAGLKPGNPLDTLLATASSGPSGKAWAVQPSPVSNSTPGSNSPVYVASGIGAGLAPGGTPVAAWGDSSPSGGGYHAGLSTATPDVKFPGACCDLHPDAATSADGQFVLARTVNYTDTAIIARLASGQELTAPNSAAAQSSERVSLSGRIGKPGVYIAYTSGDNPFTGFPTIWRVGAAKASRLSNKQGGEHTRLAQAPGGAMWVFWENDNRIYARRSNRNLTKWGQTVSLKPPKGTQTVYRLDGDGSRGPLDVLALVQRGGGQHAYWHQRLLPGLSLTVKKKSGKLTYKVTDAGQPIKAAKVTVKRKGSGAVSKTTGSKGTASFKAKKGTYSATARKKGYAKATKKVKVK